MLQAFRNIHLTAAADRCRYIGLSLLVATAFVGCAQNSTPAPAPQSPAGATSTSPPSNASGVPPAVAQKVEALIRLNEQYCAVAEKVQDASTFKLHWDELSRLDSECSSASEDIMIAENKLTPQQRDALDRELYTPRVKPSIDQKRTQKARVLGLAP